MMEDINRVCTDKISDILFVTTYDALDNITRDKNIGGHYVLTGNTVYESISYILARANLKKCDILVTIHQRENLQDKVWMNKLIK